MTTTDTADREIPRLKARYRAEIKPALTEQFSYSNPMQIPASSRSSSTWVSATPPRTPS